jgi:hypothetical protein
MCRSHGHDIDECFYNVRVTVPQNWSQHYRVEARLLALGFNRVDGSYPNYVNSNRKANIQEVHVIQDRVETDLMWLVVRARKPFSHAAAAQRMASKHRQSKLEKELQLAQGYWLQTIKHYVKNSRLAGAEWYIAHHGHHNLFEAYQKAAIWNSLEDGQCYQVSQQTLNSLSTDDLWEPGALYADKTLKAQDLAHLTFSKIQAPDASGRIAFEHLMNAQQYLASLPKPPDMESRIKTALSTVTLAEIQQSNVSGQLPFLPPKQQARQGGKVSLKRIKTEVRKFLEHQTESLRPKLVPHQQWQIKREEKINDFLKNDRIILHDLCTMRYERFVSFQKEQAARGLKQRGKPKKKKPKAGPPNSAGSAPIYDGKRERGKTAPVD